MVTFLYMVHLIVCFTVVVIVLLQAGKGADIGAAFGGGSHTLFGSRGAGTFLTKVTAAAGAIFMLTSLSLSIMASGVTSSSVVTEPPAAAKGSAPAMPEVPKQGAPFVPANPAPGKAAAPAMPTPPAK